MEERNVRIARELVRLAKDIVAGGGERRRVTLKEIKSWYGAIDATRMKPEELPERPYDIIAVSHGVNGVNGCVFADTAGNVYKITERNANLFRVV